MRILYFFAKKYWDHKASIGRRLYGEAVSKQPNVTLRFWGPGWPRFNVNKTLGENLAEYDFQPDVLWFYKADEILGAGATGIPAFCVFNEFRENYLRDEACAANAGLIFLHHKNEMGNFPELACVRKFIPHAAEQAIFSPGKPWGRRVNPVIVTGATGLAYPLRTRMAKVISSGKIPGVVRAHPGHNLKSKEAIDTQYRAYARQLGDSKLALICSSRFRYDLAKYAEAAMAGCAILGDIPDGLRDTLGQFIIAVSPDASEADITAAVKAAIADDRGLKQRAQKLHQLALEKFSTKVYAKRLVAGVRSTFFA